MSGIKIKDAPLVEGASLTGNERVPISAGNDLAAAAKIQDIRGYDKVGSDISFKIGTDTYILHGAEKVVKPNKPTISGSSTGYKQVSITPGNMTSGATFYYIVTTSTTEDDPEAPDASTITTSSSSGNIVLNQDSDHEYIKYKVVGKAYKNGAWSDATEVFSCTVYRRLESVVITENTTSVYATSKTVTLTQSEGGTIYYKYSGDDSYTEYTEPLTVETTKTIECYATKSNWDNATVSTKTITVGAKKIYYGLVNSAPATASAIEALTAVAPTGGPTDATLNAGVTTSQFSGVGAVCFAYPATLRDLTSIKDNSNAEYISDFVKTTVDGYKVYTMESALVDQTGLSYTFK